MLETVEVAHGFMFEFSHSWKSLESEDGGRIDTQTTRPEESELREASRCMRQPVELCMDSFCFRLVTLQKSAWRMIPVFIMRVHNHG